MTHPKKITRNTILIVIIFLLSPYLVIESAIILISSTYRHTEQMNIQFITGMVLIVVCLGFAIYKISFLQIDKPTRWVYLLMTAIPILGLGLLFMGSPMYLFAGLVYVTLILTFIWRYIDKKI